MAVMTSMREHMSKILIALVIIPFLGLIVIEWGMDFVGIGRGGRENIGSVNGKDITYKEFSDALRSFSDNQKAQTGVEPDDSQLPQLRNQVWESMVNERLIEEQVQKLGVTVTDQEINDWVRGDNPPEDLKRNFIDSTGQFRRDVYEQFLGNPNQFVRDPEGADPGYGSKWLVNYEKSLRERMLRDKLQSLVLASVQISPGDILRRYQDQNLSFQVLYALLDPNTLVKDDEVTVSDNDLKSLYDENIEQYRFEATRKLKYVLLNTSPSAEDSAACRNDIDHAANEVAAGIDFLEVASLYSGKPDSGAWFKHGELDQVFENAVFGGKVNDIVGPIAVSNGYQLAKILEERKGDNEYIHASHVLFSLNGTKDSNAVKEEARQVYIRAKAGADFAELAKTFSEDPGSAARGGDLGWFSRGRMVKSFEDAAYKARPGEIVGPVRSQFGLHIIKVMGKDNRELKLASIRVPITTSEKTKSDLNQRAEDFSYNANESDFEKEAERAGFDVRESQVQEKGGVVPGIGVNESITRWAFNNTVGSVSGSFSLPAGYAVFTVVEVTDAGVRGFDEVKASLQPQALRKKKIEKVKRIATEALAKLSPSDSLWKISELTQGVQVQRAGPFTLSGTIPGVGRDQGFLGTSEGLSVGQISKPIEGLRGVYVIQLVARSEFDSSAFATQRTILENQMLQEKKNRFIGEWLASLKEKASIDDRRDVFFR
ncbi:MAG TPA: peptidylprolyl isomerase [Bacteroidota bacterium]